MLQRLHGQQGRNPRKQETDAQESRASQLPQVALAGNVAPQLRADGLLAADPMLVRVRRSGGRPGIELASGPDHFGHARVAGAVSISSRAQPCVPHT